MMDVSTVTLANENCTISKPSSVHLVSQLLELSALIISNKLAERAPLNSPWVVVLQLI